MLVCILNTKILLACEGVNASIDNGQGVSVLQRNRLLLQAYAGVVGWGAFNLLWGCCGDAVVHQLSRSDILVVLAKDSRITVE